MLALIVERPCLRAPLLETVVETQPVLGMDDVEHDVDMRMRLVVMRDEDRLVILPFHVAKKLLARFDHVLAGRLVVGRPIEAQMLDRIFRGAAPGTNAGFLFEKLGVARGPQHLVDGRRHMVVGAIECVGPGDAFVGFRLGIVGEIGGKAREGFSARQDSNDHRGTRARRCGEYL
ncbi:MAG: hypothetical protein ABSC25_08725 [Roseiarcus sp.]